ncbi:MAG: hypothetical protein UR26_C0006G0022 [candidate division TM6 bacterium GW2011_GWF2_32_72]|nr:MAG: hypothetical protein UR26_C0006G0022 [candidate division TM6 bacterium GW2011_GWF2_32_72]
MVDIKGALAINASIFVQAINFIITYLILKNFLFKPVVNIIQEEEQAENLLNSSIKSNENDISKAVEHRKKDWNEFKNTVKEKAPEIESEHAFLIDVSQTLQQTTIPEQDAHKLKTELTSYFVKKVENEF